MVKKITGYIVLAVMTGLLFFGAKQWVDNKNDRISYLEESYNRVEKERDEAREELGKRSESNQATGTIVKELEETKAVEVKKQTEAEKAVKKKVQEINDKYSKLPNTPNNQQLKETEIATERVRGLWKSFCISEPKAEDCVQ
jgi:seryl-tRNA synthetase